MIILLYYNSLNVFLPQNLEDDEVLLDFLQSNQIQHSKNYQNRL